MKYFLGTKMARGNAKIDNIFGKVESFIDELESGVVLLMAHKDDNNTEIARMTTENAEISNKITKAVSVKDKLLKLLE